LWDCIREFNQLVKGNGWLEVNRREQRGRWLRESLEQGLAELFRSRPSIRECVAAYEREVLEGRTTPFRAARELLEMYANSGRRELGSR
jgi:LAO/AO transport system kinase